MKKFTKLNIYKTKDILKDKRQNLEKFLPSAEYTLLSNFRLLTMQQQLYILETVENLKKHNL